MPLEGQKLRIGEMPPKFCLPDGLTGGEVCLKDFLGGKLYLTFLKGSW
jgi:peroxiredoxin